MLDGIELHGYTNIVALGITTEGEKLALGLWEGSTENAAVAGALLSDLVDRGVDVEQGLLFVIDGSKALRKAIRRVFGNDVPVQRCTQHKQRNVLDHLPERDRRSSNTSTLGAQPRSPASTARATSYGRASPATNAAASPPNSSAGASNGPSGRGVNNGSQTPHSTVKRRGSAERNCRSSAVLPIPASPYTSATRPWAVSATSETHRCSLDSSSARSSNPPGTSASDELTVHIVAMITLSRTGFKRHR